jgi:hypothetical protein
MLHPCIYSKYLQCPIYHIVKLHNYQKRLWTLCPSQPHLSLLSNYHPTLLFPTNTATFQQIFCSSTLVLSSYSPEALAFPSLGKKFALLTIKDWVRSSLLQGTYSWFTMTKVNAFSRILKHHVYISLVNQLLSGDNLFF